MAITGDVTWFGSGRRDGADARAVRTMRLYFVVLAFLGLAGARSSGSRTGSRRPERSCSRRRSISFRRSARRPGSARSRRISRIPCSLPAAAPKVSTSSRRSIGGSGCARRASSCSPVRSRSGLPRRSLRYRFALRWFVGPSLVVLGYFLAGALFDVAAANVDTLIRYNVGQYRHALGLTFASLAIALTLATGSWAAAHDRCACRAASPGPA